MLKCDVIQDLLPLYQDKITSAESTILVEEHISNCPSCKAFLDALQTNGVSMRVEIDDAEISALRKMKKKLRKKSIIMILLGILVTLVAIISSIALFGHSFPIDFLLSSERIGSYERAAMRESRQYNEASTMLIVKGEGGNHSVETHFPLPNGAVPFENNEYSVREGSSQYLITTESLEPYLNELLPQNGYIVDRLGDWIAISNSDNSFRVGISTSMFTKNFMRLEITIISDAP